MRRTILTLAAVLVCAGASRAAESYHSSGECGGFPGVALQTPPELCVGLVAEHLGFARGVAVVGDAVYVLDMGGWRPGRGRLLRLGHGGHDAPEVLLTGLDEPNGLAVAPDGTLYAGLLGRIVKVTPHGKDATLDNVVVGLPSTGRHPLSALTVAADGSLYVNVGSETDHCERGHGAPDPAAACPERAGKPERAAIIHVTPQPGHPVAWPDATTMASGLRNSMGLATMPGGALVAVVNARDAINRADPALSDALLPHDTLVVIKPEADYGWPYCFDENRASPEYAGYDCSAMTRPTLLLPAHAAPLGLLYYEGSALGLNGRLVIPYHGYRAEGHRIVSLAVDADGQPTGAPVPLVWGWDNTPGRNPQGAPVALAELPDGSVLVTEDHNGTLLRLARR